MQLSIITINFNNLEGLKRTAQSILSQTWRDFEWIIIDGGSTDGSKEYIEQLAACLSGKEVPSSNDYLPSSIDYRSLLLWWCSEKDGGIYPAMNKGLLHSTSEWVNFMNSGDEFADNNVLQDIFGEGGKLSINNCQLSIELWLLGGNTINFFPDGREEIHHAEPADVIPERLPFSHQASFVKREVCHFDENYRYAADYALFYEMFYQYGPESIRTIDRAIARYQQGGSTTMLNAKKVKGEYLRIQSSHRTWHWWKEYVKWRWM